MFTGPNLPQERIHIPVLIRNLSRDLVGPDGVLVGLLPEPEVIPQIDQG
jgi:hypothetical protein